MKACHAMKFYTPKLVPDLARDRGTRFIKVVYSSGRSHHQRRGSRDANSPRNIIVKLAKWKVKEKILKEARTIKPDGVKFLNDFSSRTLERCADKIPQLIEARQQGKIAYFIMDKLIIKNRPPTQRQDVSQDSEGSFDTV